MRAPKTIWMEVCCKDQHPFASGAEPMTNTWTGRWRTHLFFSVASAIYK